MSTPAAARWRPPGQCEVCRTWCPGGVCTECLLRFAPPAVRCLRCGLRVGTALSDCGECLRAPPPFERTVCGTDYAFPWDRLIAAFKFHGRIELASQLAERLLQALREADAVLPDLVLPVPLAAPRLAERGYNQAWELARRVARALDRPADASLLQRPLANTPQAALTRAERLAHLRGVFMVDPRRRDELQGRRVALVDDVFTTGATAREASSTLLRAGAGAVQVWVVARTP
jgi:ComF family protein